ncbi:MAG TPA: ketoacyl-ACP synthase III family protein, partial [Pseudonocardiaceae bacterium]
MKTPDIYVSGLGVHLPEIVSVEQSIADGNYDADTAEETELLGAAISPDLSGPEMALIAAKQAFARAGHEPTDVDALLYVDMYHAGPDGWCPQSYLQRELVGGDLLAANIRQGCNGMFGALELAAGYLTAGHDSALLAAGDNMGSPLVNRWQSLPEFILADSGSAVLLTRSPGFAKLLSVCSLTIPELEGMHRGAEPLVPAPVTLGKPLDLLSRFREFAKLNGAKTADAGLKLIKSRVDLVHRALDEAGIDITQITRIACNHGSRGFIDDGLLESIDLTIERSTWDFGRRVGHLGPSDQIAGFDHLLT